MFIYQVLRPVISSFIEYNFNVSTLSIIALVITRICSLFLKLLSSKKLRTDSSADNEENQTSQIVPLTETTDEKTSALDAFKQTNHKLDVVSWNNVTDSIEERCSKTELQVIKIFEKLEALENRLN